MAIDSQHPLFKANIERWTRARDCYEGEDAVKDRGILYLPKISPMQTQPEYEAYKGRASYYEAVPRTIDGFVGAISRKPHTIDIPASLDHLKTSATKDGTGLSEFIKRLCKETVLVARGAVLVEFDDATQLPYFVLYPAESIINWTENRVVVIETVYEPSGAGGTETKAISQIREMAIEENGYVVRLWRQHDANVEFGSGWAVTEEINPTRRGQPLFELPWFWFSSMGQSSLISKPPLMGLINTSLSHYRTSADLEHGRHFTALPTLYITGVKNSDPVQVGAGAVIQLANAQSRVGYAEFTGQGLGSLETALASKEHQMAMLGAAVFTTTKKGVEAAETAKIRTAGENSLLMGVVSAVEETITAALAFAATWKGEDTKVFVRINRDFMDQELNPQTIVGLVQAYQQGMLDIEIFLYCLFKAEMLPPETNIDQLAAKLRETGAPLPKPSPSGAGA